MAQHSVGIAIIAMLAVASVASVRAQGESQQPALSRTDLTGSPALNLPAADITLRRADGLSYEAAQRHWPQAAQIAAAPGRAMSLVDVFTAANATSPVIKGAQAGSDAATYGLINAYIGFLPRAQVIYSKQRVEQRVLRTDNPVYQTGRGYFGNSDRTAQIIQPILDGRIFAQLEAAYAVKDRAGYELTAAGQRTVGDTIESYLTGLAAFDDLRLAQEEVQVLEKHRSELNERRAGGLGNDADLHDLNGRLGNARAQVFSAEANIGKALADLRKVSGVPVAALFPLRPEFPMPKPSPASPEQWVAAADQHNPELRALSAGVDQAEAEYHKAIGDVLPRVELVASDDRLDAGGSLFGGGALTDQRIIEMRLTVPLFNANGQGYPLFQLAAKARQQRYGLDDHRREIEQKIRDAFLQATAAANRAHELATAAASRAQFADDLHQRFLAGVGTLSDVIDAERDAFRARRELLASHYNYLIFMTQLKLLSGAISGDDVMFVNGLLDQQHAKLIAPAG